MKISYVITVCAIICLMIAGTAYGDDLTPEQKVKVDNKIKQLSSWSTDQRIVDYVGKYNASPPAQTKGMTQEKWKGVNMLSSEVRSVAKNDLADYLRTIRDDTISEIFVSGEEGTKVAFLSKTTSWSHKGSAKHDVPMSGQIWTGQPELDESTGVQQVQIGLPVLDNGIPIGSIVIGLNLSKL